jgi:hypothetical protein
MIVIMCQSPSQFTRTLYIISLKMGDIDIHYLLNVNVSHFKADNIFVRT